MEAIITVCPKAREFSEDGFKPFELTTLTDVEVLTGRGEKPDGSPKTDMIKGKCKAGIGRVIMFDELAATNKRLIASKPNITDRKKLADELGHLAPLMTPEGLIALEGENCFFTGNPVSRNEKGLITVN